LRSFFFALAGSIVMLSLAACLFADPDPCLVVYPSGPCVYYYDPSAYYTVGPGDPLYSPIYDRGGKVLLRIDNNLIDLSVYQAPGLTGFVACSTDQGFYFDGTTFELIIDGFSHVPTTYVNILVVFDRAMPTGCSPTIHVEGSLLSGNVYPAGDLVVHTPTPDGKNYSDVMTLDVSAVGCAGVHLWAFSDENYNGVKDGAECFTAFSHDVAIPVEETTWGRVKALYR